MKDSPFCLCLVKREGARVFYDTSVKAPLAMMTVLKKPTKRKKK